MELNFGSFCVHVNLAGYKEGNINFIHTSCGGGILTNGELGFSVTTELTRIIVKNDIIGGYHIYYWQKGNDIFISDDVYEVIVSTSELPIDENEKRYFDRHGYGLADRTFRQGLYRLPPFSTLTVDEKGFEVKNNWTLGHIERTPDETKYKEAVQAAVDKSLNMLKHTNRKVLLCFSGGVDSLYIAKRMISLGIEFELLYWSISKETLQTAEKGARILGMPLVVLDVSNYSKELQNVVAKEMFFDNHYSRIHYVGCQEILKKYGTNVVLVNGQNSDSILTYGPSETKFTSYWKRYLMYGKGYIRKWIYKTIIEIGFRRRFVLPRTEEDKDRALLDNFKYCLILDKNEPQTYSDYLNERIKEIKSRIFFSSQNNLWMYLKIHTHIYGSDCQVVVNSARHFGLNLLMPFSTEEFIKAALMYKDDERELQCPKYVLK